MKDKNIGSRLKALRRGRNAGEIAEKVGCSQSVLYLYESGDRTPDVVIAYRLAKFYGINVELDRKSTRLNSSHIQKSRMPSSA